MISHVCATYTYGRRPSSWRTCRREWSNSWEGRVCGGRAPGTARRRRRRARAPWWRQRGSPPCLWTSSTTASCRALASSSGRTCSRRAAATTCPSSKARTLLALRQNPHVTTDIRVAAFLATANRMHRPIDYRLNRPQPGLHERSTGQYMAILSTPQNCTQLIAYFVSTTLLLPRVQ